MGAAYRLRWPVSSRNTVSPAATRVPFIVLCGAPARWRTATTGPKQMMSLPAR